MQIEEISQSYSSEIACVVLCCRVYIKTTSAEELEQFVLTHEIEWQEVYKLAAAHRVRPVVYHVLNNFKHIPLPSDFYNYCKLLSVFAFERRMESARIQQLLLQHQVPARMYKGLDFTIRAYDGDISMREFTDMDLIVDKEQLSIIADVMTAEGYTSNQLDYFRRFPGHFKARRKDICFEKRNANGRLFSFEFHYRPTNYMLVNPLGFDELLGKDYLTSTLPITRQQYYQLMLISHGVSDYYPNLRSLVDLVMLAGDQSMYVPQALQQHEQLGKALIGKLLNGVFEGEMSKSAKALTVRLLTSSPLSFGEKMTMRIRFSKSPRTFFRALQIIIHPNEEDINRTHYPYFQIYYFVRPIHLLKKLLPGLIPGRRKNIIG